MTSESNDEEVLIQKTVFCIACREEEFRVFVTEEKIIMSCIHCGWKIVVNVKKTETQESQS